MEEEGKELIQEMMNLNMLIDISHMSQRTVEDLSEFVIERNWYPVFSSHARIASIMENPKELYLPDWALAFIKRTGIYYYYFYYYYLYIINCY